MFTPNEIEAIPQYFEQLFRDLQLNIMTDLVQRLSINQEITRTADWEINRLYELGKSKREIKKYIKDTLDLNTQEVNHLYKDVLRKGYARNEQLYKTKGKPMIRYENNKPLQQFIKAVKKQTDGECKNITQSLGFAVKQPDGKIKFQPIADYYQKTLDNASMDILSGAFDYNTVLKRTVKEMTNSGLRTVDYASGWSNRVDVAARRAVMTGFNQVVAKITEDNAEQLDTEYFEVTRHIGARPTHQPWQGRVYSKPELVTVCGYGTVTGLKGANCYHDFHPFIKGVSKRTYTDEELDRMNKEENTPKKYGDKEYTTYEALQRQRKLETTMRAQRQEIHLLKTGNASEDDILAAQSRYRVTSAEYTHFSKEMGLPQQRERVTVDGLGKIGANNSFNADKSVANSYESGIIKENSRKAITKITDSAIENVPEIKIVGYSSEQCSVIQNQHKELLKYSKQNNNNNEVAFVFRKGLTDRAEFSGKDDTLEFGNGLLGKGNELFVMHNHPRNSSYSVTDLILFRDYNNIKTLTIVKNNGNVEYITKSKDFDSQKFKLEFDRLYRKIVLTDSDNGKDKFVKALLTKTKSGVIWSERK